MSKETDYIKGIDGAERRYFTAEVRADKAEENALPVIEGYAALYSSPTTIGNWFREEILPGAFDDVLNDDIRCLFNHDPNFILARSKDGKGSLELILDKKGLKYRYTTPNRQYAIDLADAIATGDVSQSSFAFKPKETIWRETEGELDLRQIVKMDVVYDVSPVTYPAYADTSVAKRSHDAYLVDKAKEIETNPDKPGNDKVLKRNAAQIIINQNL